MGRHQTLRVGSIVGSADDSAHTITIADGRIATVGAADHQAVDQLDLSHLTAVPGFVDMHCHGGGGHHFAEGGDAARAAARTHLEHGTTTLVASLVSASRRQTEEQIRALRPLVGDDTITGIHLEGPWLARGRHGAHDPAALRPPEADEVDALLHVGAGAVVMVTLAPELDGAIDAIGQLVAAGLVVAIGHTDATGPMTRDAVDAGATVATHLFNAMPPLDHRDPGPAGALLRDPRVTVELIADTVHVHADVLSLALAAAGPARVALITDAMAAAGSGDGHFRLGAIDVEVTEGIARVPASGALAGSTLTMAGALRHAVIDAGWSLADAVRAATMTPARAIGRHDRGVIAPGARADIVLLDDDLTVRGVMRAGAWTVSEGL